MPSQSSLFFCRIFPVGDLRLTSVVEGLNPMKIAPDFPVDPAPAESPDVLMHY